MVSWGAWASTISPLPDTDLGRDVLAPYIRVSAHDGGRPVPKPSRLRITLDAS